jgi:hypothetical protein
MRASVALAAAAALLTLMGAGTATAASPDRLTQPQLRRALLTPSQIATASGTGFPVQSSGVSCVYSAEINANVCYRKSLHSDDARAAKAPWVTRLNVLSFRTAAEARDYIATAASDRPQSLVKRRSLMVAFDPRSMVSDGSRTETAPEASVFQAVGVNAIWSACADPSQQATASDLAACARSVAAAQATRLR